MAVRLVVPLEIFVVEVGVAEVADPVLQAAGYGDVVGGDPEDPHRVADARVAPYVLLGGLASAYANCAPRRS